MTTKNKLLQRAKKECANYSNGVCLGIYIKVEPKVGFTTAVMQRIDKSAGKNCTELVNECAYLRTIIDHK